MVYVSRDPTSTCSRRCDGRSEVGGHCRFQPAACPKAEEAPIYPHSTHTGVTPCESARLHLNMLTRSRSMEMP